MSAPGAPEDSAAVGGATLRRLFEQALDCPPAQRDQWLRETVVDQQLRARLSRLLAADASSGALDEPAAVRAERLDLAEDVPAGDRLGQTFAGFRLLRLLGEGGMATVFLGEREGADFKQLAAVKLLRRSLYSAVEQRLFQRERRTLAALEHPHIARLIDGGVTGAGVPFLVLEYVDGVPITDSAQARSLSVRDRLRLMIDVCRAVAAAHRALVVHRDLKPANILVDREGRPKLLDFGIAKLLAEDEPDAGGARTAQYVLTPDYAAPEQFAGGEISTATDVYALGVILHELLTGGRPALAGAALRGAPGRLAVVAARPTPEAVVPRELSNVLGKALAEDAAARYADASALADELQRYLDGQPVHAHPPSRWYRARKFVGRHRGSVVLSLVLALGMCGGLAAALWQAGVARSEARRATEVQRFLEDLFAPLESGRNADQAPSIAQLLERGLQRLDAAPPGDPKVRADLLGLFARINDGIGEIQANVALCERAATAATDAFGADDRRTLDARALWGRVLRKSGEYRRADEVLESVRAAMQRLGIGGLAYAQVADAQLNARVLWQRVAPQEIVRRRRELLALREADPTAGPDDIATGYNNLGIALEGIGDYPAALDAHQRAFDLRHEFLGDSAGAASNLANTANVLSWMKQWQRALQRFGEARAMYERAGVRRHHGYAGLLVRMCDLEALLELHAAAAADCAAGLEMAQQLYGTSHLEYAWALQREGGRRLAAGRLADSAEAFDAARGVLDRAQGASPEHRLRIDIAEAGRWRLAGDYVTLRERLLPIADLPRYAGHVSAPLVYAWLALACDEAPAPACGDDRRAAAEAVLAEPRFANDPLRLPARTALARIDLRHGARSAAAAGVQAELRASREIGPGHAWRGEAWALLAQALETPAERREAHDQAQRIFDALPEGHVLRGERTAAARH